MKHFSSRRLANEYALNKGLIVRRKITGVTNINLKNRRYKKMYLACTPEQWIEWKNRRHNKDLFEK